MEKVYFSGENREAEGLLRHSQWAPDGGAGGGGPARSGAPSVPGPGAAEIDAAVLHTACR